MNRSDQTRAMGMWERLRRWTGASVDRRILRAAVTVSGLTACVRLLGAIKEPVVAAYFGAGAEMDAFLIAFLLPTFVLGVSSSAFTATFIPTYVRLRDGEGPEAADGFLSSALVFGVGGLTLGGLAILGAARPLVELLAPDFTPEKIDLARSLLVILVPTILVKGVSTLWASVLNSYERFATAALAPAAIPLTVLAFVVLADDESRIYGMAVGVLCGYVGEALVLARALRRRGLPILPRVARLDPHLKLALGQYGYMLFGATVMSGATVVDQAMAASLDPGSVSRLHYGQKLTALAVSVAATGLGTVLTPFFARMIAARDWRGLRRTLRRHVALVLSLSLPAVAVLVLGAEWFVQLLFERGAFVAADTAVVTDVHRMYALQIPPYLLGIVAARVLSSARRNHWLMLIALGALPLNVVLNLVFMSWMGVPGIALSTSIVYVVTFVLSGSAVWRIVRDPARHGLEVPPGAGGESPPR